MNWNEPMAPTKEIASAKETPRERKRERRGVLRGSSLLLVGRLLSVGVNFFVQVLAVRYLIKADYGALAWALSVASMGSSLIQLGLQRGVSRFVPIHEERHEYGEMFGTMAMAIGAVVGLGLSLVVAVIGAGGFLERHVVSDPTSAALLLILIGLAPTQALDNIFQGLLAIFAGARAIFFRRYVLGPGLKLLAVLLVVAVKGSVEMLAVSYLVAGVIGVTIYVGLLWKVLANRGLLAKLHLRQMRLPVRRMLSFSLPLITTDLMMIFETTFVVVLLERLHGTVEVASLRAVVPVAGLCMITYQTIKLLFRPQAARYWARGDEAGLGKLYWQSVAWVAVATFPVFATIVTLAQPVTVLLFGPEYASSGVLLAILAVGKYFNAAIGMNTFTLQVYGRVRMITVVNIISAIIGVGLAVWLIGTWSALGAAIATTATIIIRNTLYQFALMAVTGVGRPPARALAVYGSVAALIAVLQLARLVTTDFISLVFATLLASAALVYVNRRTLDVHDTFPELAKVPLLRHLF